MTTEGKDAVVFTAGPKGAAFGAGVVHAWLAADREPPLVSAGISIGSVSAAAMERVHRELAEAPRGSSTAEQRESARWMWYRKYLKAVTDDPLDFLWRAIPDPVDFAAATGSAPVRDKSLPSTLHPCAGSRPPEGSALEQAQRAFRARRETARIHYYLLTQLGKWASRIPVRVSTLASMAIFYTRIQEGYGTGLWPWFGSRVYFYANAAKAVAGLGGSVLRGWTWFIPSEETVGAPTANAARRTAQECEADIKAGYPDVMEQNFGQRLGFGPLFGWGFYSLVLLATLLLVAVCGWGVWLLVRHTLWDLVLVAVLLLAAGALVWLADQRWLFSKTPRRRSGTSPVYRLLGLATGALGMKRAVLSQFELERRLIDLFDEFDERGDAITDRTKAAASRRMELLIVCAALERKEQVLPSRRYRVSERLVAALSIPGIFPPRRMMCEVRHKDATGVVSTRVVEEEFSLIDGSAVRSNPIPVLFSWCRSEDGKAVASDLEATDAKSKSLHVVYPVPIEQARPVTEAPPLARFDIVESAMAALELEESRDTRQEVRQTAFLAELSLVQKAIEESARTKVGAQNADKGEAAAKRIFCIFPDEIAPREPIRFRNNLSPKEDESLAIAAAGCRATLERLYRTEIKEGLRGRNEIPCWSLLHRIAPGRHDYLSPERSGLGEVCSACTRRLQLLEPEITPAPKGVISSYGEEGRGTPDVPQVLRHLNRRGACLDQGRVVFLGSGGVFRGAFHIGVISALEATQLFPDLVIGASVGALMGGALANIATAQGNNGIAVLHQLAALFIKVDERVALTRTIKNAVKQLAVRCRQVDLSPAEIRKLMMKGARADAGFAVTGAPPALIDALSSVFMIPRRRTAEIASEFVADHFSQAIGSFLEELRKETLASLDVTEALMGVSLLEPEARSLLGGRQHVCQPYHQDEGKRSVSFFATTSFLNARVPLLLGRDFLTVNPSWDHTYACLSSSAFPAVFSPRCEGDVLPGIGRTDRLFADGGLFDNLPFFPAIEVLSAAQRNDALDLSGALQALAHRVGQPDIIIAAGLNPVPEDTKHDAGNEAYDSLFKIRARAASLSVDRKTNGFVHGSESTRSALQAIVNAAPAAGYLAPQEQERLRKVIDAAVDASVVRIDPSDKDHVNPTFAFCRTAGLKEMRVERSIADGCFQALSEFARIHANPASTPGANALPAVKKRASQSKHGNACPFFEIAEKDEAKDAASYQRFPCPFAKGGKAHNPLVVSIFEVCSGDHPEMEG